MGDAGVGHEVDVQVAGGRHDGRREARPAVLADQRGVVRLTVTQLSEMTSSQLWFIYIAGYGLGADSDSDSKPDDTFVLHRTYSHSTDPDLDPCSLILYTTGIGTRYSNISEALLMAHSH